MVLPETRARVNKVREMLKVVNTLPKTAKKRRRAPAAIEQVLKTEADARAKLVAEGLESARHLLADAVKRREIEKERAKELLEELNTLQKSITEQPSILKDPETAKNLRRIADTLSLLPKLVPQEIVEEEARKAGVKEGIKVERSVSERGEPGKASYNPLASAQEYMITEKGIRPAHPLDTGALEKGKPEHGKVYLSPESVLAHEIQHAKNYEVIEKGKARHLDEYLAFLRQAWKSPADVKKLEYAHSRYPGEEHAFGARYALLSRELDIKPEDILRSRSVRETDEMFEKRITQLLRMLQHEREKCRTRQDIERLKRTARTLLEKRV